jgi:hypothetical protein
LQGHPVTAGKRPSDYSCDENPVSTIFEDISVRPVVKILHYQSAEQFVVGYTASSSLADVVDGADESARTALIAEVGVKLASSINDRRLEFQIETNIAFARR